MSNIPQPHADSIAVELERVSRIFEDGFRPPPHPEVKRRPPSKRRPRQDCMSCGIDCSFATGNSNYFTLDDEVWNAVVHSSTGRLCIECFEARLGRRLVIDDFVATPFEIFSRMHGKHEIAEASLRKRGRDDLADKAARVRRQEEERRAEAEKHWREIRAQHPEWEADR